MKKAWVLNSLVLLCIVILFAGCGKSKKPKIIDPDTIFVTPQYSAYLGIEPLEGETNVYCPPVDQIETIYEHALFLSPANLISSYKTHKINVKTTTDSIIFTSTIDETTPPGKDRESYVWLAINNNTGLLDFSALENGTAYVDVYGDLDLTQTTNGFWAKLCQNGNNEREVQTTYARSGHNIGAISDVIFHTSIDKALDEVYIKLIIPWQGSFTLKGVYLYMENEVKGFRGMADRITGGKGALPENIHPVKNAAEFYAALEEVKTANNAPSIIYVDGTITCDEYQAASEKYIELGMKNLSIIGVGTNGEFDGIGFKINGENIIIQNLTIHEVLDGDGIQINNAKYVMVDHCTLYNEPLTVNTDKDKYDELISLKNQTECVILSWNELYDSHKTILVGSNDDKDALPDRKLIMHHNYIHDCGTRLPLYRGGYAHIYNNYYKDNTTGTGINCRTGSRLLIENNYFEKCKDPIGFWYDEGNISGQYDVRNNIYDSCWGSQPKPHESTCRVIFEEAYSYELNEANDVPSIVKAGAGVGKL